MVKLEEKEDRISDLPDFVIHHILSFLPSTKEAIRTGILSKRWHKQWTHVSILIFDRFTFAPKEKVNWPCLTRLSLKNCTLVDQALEHILSGSPLLKSLELRNNYFGFNTKLVIASQSLKRLVLLDLGIVMFSTVEISCPSLEELSLKDMKTFDPELFTREIENVLSGNALLESFELIGCGVLERLIICSNSLKRLVLGELRTVSDIEISCPKLEDLKLFGYLNVKTAKLLNFPSSLCATIDFCHNEEQLYDEICTSLIQCVLQQLQHVEELRIGSWFIEVLSNFMGGLVLPVLNVKCLTLNYPDLNIDNYGIACVLRNSPTIEKLVIHVPIYLQFEFTHSKLNDFGENYWNSNVAADFNFLISHLKTIEIIGFPKKDDIYKVLLNFIRFLLMNARVLEKMVVRLKDHGTAFPSKVLEELLSLPRFSRYATIELL